MNIMGLPAIEIQGLTKDFPLGFWRRRQRRSLDNLTLQVEEGEIFGFLGPNGAGKTTTLKLLMGLIFPTAGTARIRGRVIKNKTGRPDRSPRLKPQLTTARCHLLHTHCRCFNLPR